MKIMKLLVVLLGVMTLAACSSTGGTSGSGGDSSGGDTTGTTGPAATGGAGEGIVADHTVIAAFDAIPASAIDAAKSSLHIYYGHTSHGSQLITGAEMLDDAVYERAALDIEEESGDLGTGGATAWADTTRTRLGLAGSDINVVMWSWCGGVSSNDAAGIDAYLAAMDALESEYPSVRFVYMTGHTDGTGASGTLRTMNARIRAWCVAHDKILYDFEDIESYDPAGAYYAEVSDACEWCGTWCASHTCASCGDCAHSHCFNCYQKGKTLWWLLARIAGWSS